MDEALSRLLSELNSEAPDVRAEFGDLFDPIINIFPIPFFGNLLNAKVATVGLNPSDGEIRNGHWPRSVDSPMLFRRLTEYFNNSQFPPHPWFDTWNKALGEVGMSYADGSAVHIDICPWPTRPMSSLINQEHFEKIVVQNLSWFWQCIRLATNLRLVFIAGAVSKKYYINEFLSKENNVSDTELIGKIPRGGTAFVGYHRLLVSGKEYPVFFCSVSPSSRNHSMLPGRVHENRDQLLKFLT
jgi:hypothetical protein